MAESSPWAIAATRNVLFISFRAGNPKETLVSPPVVCTPGISRMMRPMASIDAIAAGESVATG